MREALLINRTADEVRVALVEGGRAVSFSVERDGERGAVGNIYKARVVRVLPGMQAAFLEAGLERSVFLYVGDLPEPEGAKPEGAKPEPAPHGPSFDQEETLGILGAARPELPPAAEPEEEPETVADAEAPLTEPLDPPGVTVADVPLRRPGRDRRIEDLLKPGQQLVVQVSKEALGTKGARVTAQLSLPGRFLVLLPGADHVGVSRRIEDEEERDRLRAMVEQIRRPGEGFIVRTASEGRSFEDIAEDIEYLRGLRAGVDQRAAALPAPSCLHVELDLVLRSARDLLAEGVEALFADDPGDFARLQEFVGRFMPRYLDRVRLWDRNEPLFEAWSVHKDLKRALGRAVQLPSGGHIVIDRTEALTAIDVNSGRFVGSSSLEDTILQVNLEAAKEIVHQLRLRDLGGLIVVDFIDMERPDARKAVYDALVEGLQTDRARSSVLPVSEFGLVEMTRRRVREDLHRSLTEPCSHCAGRGSVKSPETVAYEILRELSALGPSPGKRFVVRCEAAVAEHLKNDAAEAVTLIAHGLGAAVAVEGRGGLPRERYTLTSKEAG